MAVVFISPKQRQKMFFLGITGGFLLFMLIVSLGVFLSKPKEVLPTLVFNKPKVNVNMDIFSSDQFKGLQAFTKMQTQYSYKALSKDNKLQTGFVSAVSIDDAKAILKNKGLDVYDIKEAEIGRINPFVPYMEVVVPPVQTKTTTAKTKTTTTKPTIKK